MRIIKARAMGMCFGVRDAIEAALSAAKTEPLTVLGELAHNPQIHEQLRQNGVRQESDLANAKTKNVMITAHGASDSSKERARERGHHVLDAACPLVRHAHQAVRRLVEAGFHPIIVGRRDHVEVRGLVEDLAACDVILTPEDVDALAERTRFGVAAQTTQPIERALELVERIRKRFPRSEVRFVDTVCQPTKERQRSAYELAQECDVIVVVGGRHSNNTRELADTCRRFGAQVHQVERADELEPFWFTRAETVGLTAGTSTPDSAIAQVEARLLVLAPAANRNKEAA
ncbi:MAG: 4-hydroxy-3-methylbut-2-enyl diphosphate reductase [Verrucomicrobiae bacterium]|nr:4-hydroxy-3-methylbut-2-enyl diphosphate reductase [Verrucomicrobiae bacterium]